MEITVFGDLLITVTDMVAIGDRIMGMVIIGRIGECDLDGATPITSGTTDSITPTTMVTIMEGITRPTIIHLITLRAIEGEEIPIITEQVRVEEQTIHLGETTDPTAVLKIQEE